MKETTSKTMKKTMKKTIALVLTFILIVTLLTGCLGFNRLGDIANDKPPQDTQPQDTQAQDTGLPLGKYTLVSIVVDGDELIDYYNKIDSGAGDIYFALKENEEFSLNFTAVDESFDDYTGRGKFEVDGDTLYFDYFDGYWDELKIDGDQVSLIIDDDFIMVFEKTYKPGHVPVELSEFEKRLAALPSKDQGPTAEEFAELTKICVSLFWTPESVILTDDSWTDHSNPYGYGRLKDATYRKELIVFGKPTNVSIRIDGWFVDSIVFTERNTPSVDAFIAMIPGVTDIFGTDRVTSYINGEKLEFADAKKKVASVVASGDYGTEFSFKHTWNRVKLDGDDIYIDVTYYYRPGTTSDTETMTYTFTSHKILMEMEEDLAGLEQDFEDWMEEYGRD